METVKTVEKAENKRVKMTKFLICTALSELMTEKPINKIKINELCERAQVNRSTFYKYYGSQYDVLKDIQEFVFGKIQEMIASSKEKNYRDGLIAMLEFVRSYLPKMQMPSDFNYAVEHNLPGKLAALPGITSLLELYASKRFSGWEIDYIKQFFVLGALAVIHRWLTFDTGRSTGDIADVIIKIAEGLMIKPD